MEDVLAAEHGMLCDAVEEGLEETLAASNHIDILFRFALLDCIISYGGLRGYWGYNKGWIKPDQIVPERLKLRVSVLRLCSLHESVEQHTPEKMGGRLTPERMTYVMYGEDEFTVVLSASVIYVARDPAECNEHSAICLYHSWILTSI